MKKINFLFLIIALSCKGNISESTNKNNNYDMNDSIHYSSDEKPSIYIADKSKNYDKGFLIYYNNLNLDLSKKGFKSPDKEFFRKKIIEIFKIDIDTSKYNEIYLIDLGLVKSVNIAFYNERTILANYEIGFDGELPKKIDASSYLYFNRMIFYNDLHATNWIKANEPFRIVDLIKIYGCTSNDDWTKFAFSKIAFTNSEEVEDLLFEKKIIGTERAETGEPMDTKLVLRKEMLEKMIEFNAEPSMLSSIATLVENCPYRFEGDPLEIIAYLYDATYRLGATGLLEYLYDRNISYKDKFKKHDYYGLKDLKEYSEEYYKLYEEREKEETQRLNGSKNKAMINDPDGYTNVHKEASVKSEVIFKIYEGKIFLVTPTSSDWWKVEFEGKTGYIHKSRVSLK